MNPAAATERLYYTDAYTRTFDAHVVDRADEGRRVYLASTHFYPTSGGQPHDLGLLGDIPVVDVIDEGDRVAHVLAQPLAAADSIRGAIDWTRRFDNMQQHTGQHLLSAVFEDLCAARTVSVHFGDDHSTVDLEIDSLSAEKLARVERRANEIIAENRSVTVGFEDAATAKGLRKAVDREGELRIVTIDNLDRSACGGTHVRSTGEIGCVTLRATERIRKTMRVEFNCGLRAVARARTDYELLTKAAASVSAAIADLPGIVVSQAAQLKESEQAKRDMEKQLATFRIAAMYDAAAGAASANGIRRLRVTGTSAELRVLAQEALKRSRVVFEGVDANDVGVLLAATEDSGVDASRLLRESLAEMGGKGGGSPRLAQGSAPDRDAAARFWKLIDARLSPDR